jgi:hypothetical protein
LASEIRDAGHTVWFDEWEIKPGDSLVEQISSALSKATYVVLCYSSHGMGSPWVAREWHSTLARQLDGTGVKIIPARLTGEPAPPAILADIKYVDLVKDWDKGVSELLRALG